jgi:ribonuclease J
MEIVQIVPLGGASEIGRSCYAIVQGEDMVVVDVGLSFPNEEMHGVGIVIPDFTFIIENKHKLRGIFLTHAHEDHSGALPYLLPYVKCPVYASDFTLAFLQTKLEEKNVLKSSALKPIRSGDRIKAGSLEVEPLQLTHSIPENHAIAIRTVHGIILFTSDFKFDFTPVDGKLSDINRLAEFAEEGVLVLLSDSTNIERPGWGPSEKSVTPGLRQVFSEAQGRIFLTTFASSVHRMQQAISIAEEMDKKFAVAGRSMEQSVAMCFQKGYLRFRRDSWISLDEIGKYAPNEILILTTGSQGEPLSALVQMSKDDYSRLKIVEGDTIIYSARPIPGNEAAIWRTVNRLFRMGANVVYETIMPIHASGHAYQEEIKMMVNITRPYYLAPIHGEPRHHHLYKKIAHEMGYPESRIFDLSDGIPLSIDAKKAWFDDPVPVGEIYIDSSGSTEVTPEIIRERKILAEDGVLVVNLMLDKSKPQKILSLEIKHRGFAGDPKTTQTATEILWEGLMELPPATFKNQEELDQSIRKILGKFLQRKTQQRPLILSLVNSI